MTVETTEPEVNAIQKVAAQYGIDPEKLLARRRSLAKIKHQEGLVVDLDIGKWLGETKLKEDIVGVKLTEVEKRRISLGHQKLFPAEIINAAQRAEGQGRANLERHAFSFEEGFFVPVTAWEEWKKENERLKAEFFKVRDEIATKYDSLVAQARKDFAEQAEAVWSRMEDKPPDKTEWVKRFVGSLMAKIPTKEEICGRFYWVENFRYLRMPSEIERELLEQQKIHAERSRLHFEEEDRKKKVSEMNDVVVAQLRKEKEKAVKAQEDFIWQAMKTQREEIQATLTQAFETIARNDGKLPGATVKALQNMVDRSKLLNFFDDAEVSAGIGKIEKFLSKKPEHRSVRTFKTQAEEIKRQMAESVRMLADEKTREEEVCRIVGADLLASVRSVE